MKRKHRFLAIGAMALLLIALCLPVLSGALAAGEEEPLIVSISQDTAVFGADGAQFGTLKSVEASGTLLQLVSGEEFANIQVVFDQAAANDAAKNDALTGKTLVLLIAANITPTPEVAPESAPETATVSMPTECWIDASLVVSALTERHAADASALAEKEATIADLRAVAVAPNSDIGATMDLLADETPSGIFSPERIATWAPLVALALGVIAVAALVWMAVSNATTAWAVDRQTRLLTKLNERLAEGLSIKTPLRIEQIAWPREGHVQLAPNVMDQLAAVAIQGSIYNSRYQEPEIPVVVEPVRIPEGEEPDLLQLANRLAGIASAAEWHAIVKDAGWKAALLQANPTEKGTFIADDSGYSIIACLMRTPDADLGYVLPSYQDPNASERRWMEFYSVNENNSVRNYRVDALAVVHIERGTFYLPKSNGRLTRRKQEF